VKIGSRTEVAAALLLTGMPATGQMLGAGADGALFVDSLRDHDSNKAYQLVSANPLLVNARNGKGDTALLVVVASRDEQWTSYLLTNGANPNLAARNGDAPLAIAARVGFEAAIPWLLGAGAKVDAANRMGETALILAVQQRRLPVVKLLLASGADPDKADSAAGYSARDYARRDTRNPQIFRLIEQVKPARR
jgi:ankyrin repeat protein